MVTKHSDRKPIRTLVHVSDLHVGRSAATDRRVEQLASALAMGAVDHVVLTGDVTHGGRRDEWRRFARAFRPLIDAGRLTAVPGNHDRLGDDVGATVMNGRRVQIVSVPGVHLVCFDSTGHHNQSFISGHGEMTTGDLQSLRESLAAAPPGHMVVLLLHHHPLPLPHDNRAERFFSWLGWSSGEALALGKLLIQEIRGRCDLILHGHRHQAGGTTLFAEDARPLSVFNAGSTIELGYARVFSHRDGLLLWPWRRLSIGGGPVESRWFGLRDRRPNLIHGS